MVPDIPNATMGMHRPDAIRAGLISGHRHSACAGGDHFVRVKAEASYLAARSDHSLAGAGGKGQYRIFHDANVLLLTAFQNALTIRPRQLASLATKKYLAIQAGGLEICSMARVTIFEVSRFKPDSTSGRTGSAPSS